MAEQESAATYGFDPARFRVVEDPKPTPVNHVPPPTDGVPNLLRGSLPQSVQLPPDFTAGNEYPHIPVYRLLPPQPSGVAGVNSAVQSTSRPISTEAAGVVVGKALPGTVSPSGNVSPATLNNVGDGSVRFAREAAHSSYVPTTNPLTATDAGASATVSIGSFTMQVAGKAVSISSGSIVGLSYSTLYNIFYSDATVSGGSVAFSATTNKPDALDTTSLFFCGSITTPASGAPDTIGNNDGGVGGQIGAIINSYAFATAAVTGGGMSNATFVGGSGTVSSSIPTLSQEWTPFVPAPNDAAAISRVISVGYGFAVSSAVASFFVHWSANSGSGTLASGSTTTSGIGTATLPLGTDLTTLNITASATYSSGAGHALLNVGDIRVIETS